ncbi:class III lanthionine synthetase LanKC [Streptomyces roseirectus]|uniref:non-specific serine/threonine protein kinase n=1 Tax=Streptomyces roseirectus TaxID=2768066 RepID=A0A7H0IIP8_9ACTN|nr:class III lanthionine synthetase LanKC [Streptomyces roseirectus]QNP72664.1 class III lanthionine synthetase LanKC [Streptomyces roseirectus]
MDAYRRVLFLAPGTPFFDRVAEGDDDDFRAETPDDWTSHTGPEWTMLTPHGYRLPLQGWKIHVSATAENASRVLARAARWLVDQRMAFKFIRGQQVLQRRNGKYGDRGASGKFITVYPEDETRLALALEELGDLLDGEQGPYILSDLRWRSGPLYVRYGGFVARTMKSAKGETVPCVEDPEGRLVPDVRGPSFRPPEWVSIPACLTEAVEARGAGTLDDFPYRAEQALHFSNGGGVYRATDLRTGTPVLLREARPFAGVDTHGEDAVARLLRERDCLRRLAGLPWVPELVEARVGYEHHFLVREFVAGETLAVRTTRDNPASPGADPARTAAYTRWAVSVLDQIEQGVRAMHERGVVFGDLHPGNVMVRPDDTIAFIDLETASTDPSARQIHAAPGFAAPPTHRGPAIDRYALGCLRLALFTPLTNLLTWDEGKLDQLIGLVEERYPVPGDYGARVRADLGAGAEAGLEGVGGSRGVGESGAVGEGAGESAAVGGGLVPGGVGASASVPGSGAVDEGAGEAGAVSGGVGVALASGEPRTPDPGPVGRRVLADSGPAVTVRRSSLSAPDPVAVGRGILATATPHREDRLFPGDTAQFILREGGTCLAYGAAGVLWALGETGTEIPAAHVDWLEESARRVTDPSPGLYTGTSGVACVLQNLGRTDAAAELLKAASAVDPGNDTLLDGRAGLGLAHLHMAGATGDDDALKQATLLAERLTENASSPTRRGEAGLLRGRSGWALLLLRLHARTPDTALLDTARDLLDADLRALGWTDDGWADGAVGTRPTFAAGSGGTALVLREYLDRRPEPGFALACDTVLRTALDCVPHTGGLFHGFAGVLLTATRLAGPAHAAELARLATTAGLYQVVHEGRPAFLGLENVRLTTDLATGAAGVLLAGHAAAGELAFL